MVDGAPESIVKGSGHLMSLQKAHFPYRNIGFNDLVIPRGTPGNIPGKMTHWQVKAVFGTWRNTTCMPTGQYFHSL